MSETSYWPDDPLIGRMVRELLAECRSVYLTRGRGSITIDVVWRKPSMHLVQSEGSSLLAALQTITRQVLQEGEHPLLRCSRCGFQGQTAQFTQRLDRNGKSYRCLVCEQQRYRERQAKKKPRQE